jgi:hypothetical protein
MGDKVMSQKLKNLLSDAEELLHHLLTNEGMTNGQALKTIKKELGYMAKDHAQEQLIMWWREDNGI